MATFNAIDLGPVVESRTTPAPTALQFFDYPGINGVGVNALGARGGTTEVVGLLAGANLAALAAIEDQFRALQAAATVASLVDTTGRTWPSVLLAEFRPVGPIAFAIGYGWAREYVMTFVHLI